MVPHILPKKTPARLEKVTIANELKSHHDSDAVASSALTPAEMVIAKSNASLPLRLS